MKKFLSKFKTSAIILLFPAAMLGILSPLEIYAGNKSELYFGIKDFIWLFAGISLAAVLVGAIILAIFPRPIANACHILCFAVTFMMYIQNMFLNKKLIKTDGSKVDWSQYATYTKINTAIWILVILGIIIGYYLIKNPKKNTIVVYISGVLAAIQLVAAASVIMTNPYTVDTDQIYILNPDREFKLAKGDNIIVIILDRYSNGQFDQMLEDNTEAAGIYQDFTYYNNANSKYNYTFPSIPYMMTHVDANCDITANEFKENVWKEGISQEFHDTLASQGYTYNLYTNSQQAICHDPENLIGSVDNVEELQSVKRTINKPYMLFIMTKTSLLKYAPYAAKPRLEIQTFYYDGIVNVEGMKYCSSGNDSFYKGLKETGLSVDDTIENQLVVAHLTGLHNPLNIDENGNSVPDDSVTIEQSQQGINLMLEEYFNQLKALGKYDESTIIITSDHGRYFDTYDLQPLYLIKPAKDNANAGGSKTAKDINGSLGELRINSAPISSEDFIPTVLDLIGQDYSKYGTSIFDWKDGDSRERQSYFPNNGFDVITYTGDRDDLSQKAKDGDYTHIDAKEDWN